MQPFRNAKETLADIGDASRRVGEAAEWQTTALIWVAAVSWAALGLAVIAVLSSPEEK